MIIIIKYKDAHIKIYLQLGNYAHASSAPVDDRERRAFTSLFTDLQTFTLNVVPLYPVTLPASTTL